MTTQAADNNGLCNQDQEGSCLVGSDCNCLFVNRPLVSPWKFSQIELVFGSYSKGSQYVLFDATSSNNPTDWMKIEVSVP